MDVDPRFTVVLASAGHPVRRRLLRLLTERFSVTALRTEATGTASAVGARLPDVLVCDPACGAGVLASIAAGEAPPRTWVVVLHEDDEARPCPRGVTRIAADASDRRVLAAVAAGGRFARAGAQTRRQPAVLPPRPTAGAWAVCAAPTAAQTAFGTLTRVGARATLSPSAAHGRARAARS